MKPIQWKQLQIEWTWKEVAWLLAHGGRERVERATSYARDVRDLAENPTPPLVAWAVDQWLAEHESPPRKRPIKRGPPEL